MKNTIILNIATLLLIVCFSIPAVTYAQDGLLDLSFDTDGIVTTAIGTSDDFGRAVAVQEDGKIIVAGYSFNGSQDVFAMVRYNTDGSLDNSFDSDGIVTSEIGASGNRAHAIAIQDDGKIVLAGYSYNGSNNDFAVARYNTNGSLDLRFDADGYATTGFDTFSNDRAFAVAIQPDGKIVIAGYNTDEDSDRDFAVVRYNTDGSLDNSFGTGGIVSTPLADGGDEVRSVVVQEDGKIVLAGFSFDFTTRVFAIVRYTSNGILDNTFDGDGIVTTSILALDDAAYNMAKQSDGKFILVGYTVNDTYDFAIVRYNTDGSLDNTFDSDGIVITHIGIIEDLPYAVTIQSDEKIVVGGHSKTDNDNFALVRYNPDGSLDNTFGTDGIVTTDIGTGESEDIIFGLALQPDGKIIATGYSYNGSDYVFATARYHGVNTSIINFADQNNSAICTYPNPFSIQTILETEKLLINATLIIYNYFGSEVKQLSHLSGHQIILDRDDLPVGMYFIQLMEGEEIIGSGEIVIID